MIGGDAGLAQRCLTSSVTDDSTIPPGRHGDATADDTGAGASGAEPSAAGSRGEARATAGSTPADAGRGARTGRPPAVRARATRRGSPDPEEAKRRRRRLISGGVAAGSALVILLVCLGFGALVRLGFRVADAADESGDRSARV